MGRPASAGPRCHVTPRAPLNVNLTADPRRTSVGDIVVFTATVSGSTVPIATVRVELRRRDPRHHLRQRREPRLHQDRHARGGGTCRGSGRAGRRREGHDRRRPASSREREPDGRPAPAHGRRHRGLHRDGQRLDRPRRALRVGASATGPASPLPATSSTMSIRRPARDDGRRANGPGDRVQRRGRPGNVADDGDRSAGATGDDAGRRSDRRRRRSAGHLHRDRVPGDRRHRPLRVGFRRCRGKHGQYHEPLDDPCLRRRGSRGRPGPPPSPPACSTGPPYRPRGSSRSTHRAVAETPCRGPGAGTRSTALRSAAAGKPPAMTVVDGRSPFTPPATPGSADGDAGSAPSPRRWGPRPG